jgi:hypothetical protein
MFTDGVKLDRNNMLTAYSRFLYLSSLAGLASQEIVLLMASKSYLDVPLEKI